MTASTLMARLRCLPPETPLAFGPAGTAGIVYGLDNLSVDVKDAHIDGSTYTIAVLVPFVNDATLEYADGRLVESDCRLPKNGRGGFQVAVVAAKVA